MKIIKFSDWIRWILTIIFIVFIWNGNKYAIYISLTLLTISNEFTCIRMRK